MLLNRHKNLESEFLLKIKSESLSRITESLSRVDRDFNELMLSQEIACLTADQVITYKDKT